MVSTVVTSKLMKEKEAAKYLAISPRTMWSLREAGEIPAVRIGRSVRYDIADLDEFIDKKRKAVG